MSRDYLFGDAKATAKATDAQRKQRVLDTAQQACNDDPSAKNQINLASAMFDLGRFDDAEKLLSKLLVQEANVDIQLLTDLGFVYKNLNQLDKAKEVFLRAAALDPKHPLARCAESEAWMIDPTYKPSWMRSNR